MSKKTWIILAAIILLFGAFTIYLISNKETIDYSDIDPTKILPAEDRNGNIADHVLGNPDSPVVIVEYGDYQCSGCAASSARLKSIIEEYEDKIAFVFRVRILPYHNNSRAATAAAEAAGFQGKYWEMHDMLFSNQLIWSEANLSLRNDIFTEYATSLGLDKDKFLEDFSSPSIAKKISFDEAIANSLNITETPTLFINGYKIESQVAGDDTKLKALIDEKLNEFSSTSEQNPESPEESSSNE